MDATVSTGKASLSDERSTYDTLVLCAAKRTSLRASFEMIVDEGGWPLFSIDESTQTNSQGRHRCTMNPSPLSSSWSNTSIAGTPALGNTLRGSVGVYLSSHLVGWAQQRSNMVVQLDPAPTAL